MKELLERFLEVRKRIKELKAEEEELKQQILEAMGDREEEQILGVGTVKVIKVVQKRLNIRKLKNLLPEVFEQFVETKEFKKLMVEEGGYEEDSNLLD